MRTDRVDWGPDDSPVSARLAKRRVGSVGVQAFCSLDSHRQRMRTELNRLMSTLYRDLREIAQSHLRGEHPNHTLGATALVNEAYLRLAPHDRLPTDRTMFLGTVSTTMRRVLVDHARRRKRIKRGGGVVPEQLDDRVADLSNQQADEMLALDAALDRLAIENPRAAQVVVLRFFGGLTLHETAEHMGLNRKTIQRDWTVALAMLRTWVSSDIDVVTSDANNRVEGI